MSSLTFLYRRLIAAVFVAVCAIPTVATAQNSLKNVVTTEQMRAELMGYAPDGADAGKTVWVGLQLQHAPEWHTYWKNSGESGQPTELHWTLPVGVIAGDIVWPVPKTLPTSGLVTYGFDGTVLLPVPLTITPDFKPSVLTPELEIKLQASWLICKQECVPQDGEFVLRLPTKSSTALNATEFQAAEKARPQTLTNPSSMTLDGQTLKVSVPGLPTALQGKTLELFPETADVVDPAGVWKQAWNGAVWTATVPLSPQRSTSPDRMPLVLVSDVGGQRSGFATLANISGNWPTQAATPTAPSGGLAVTGSTSTPAPLPARVPTSFWLALLGAVLGGMILNLMPCVFPVLAIKVMSFTRHADDRHGHHVSGLAYSAGVVLSFLALGALMLTLRSAGEELGWGFQLQSPAVVAALAALFTIIGLNLSGLFEFGQFVPSSVAVLEAKNPAVNAFLSGILAVVIASPCTAPFMGASLGLALSLPSLQALAIFAALGAGMALPYLAASWSPALARLLPRPGAWMDTFKRFMAFPMFATVIWLVWVLGQQTGIDGAASLLVLLMGLATVIWALTLHGRARRLIASFSIALFLVTAWAIGNNVTHFSEPAGSVASTERWQAWAPGKVDQTLATGQPVFVDFTATWCVTCQYNKKNALANTDVLADLDAKKVVLLRADWTRRDPAITEALAALGRNGVPVYVFYTPGKAPVVLSEILSVSEVRSAIAGL